MLRMLGSPSAGWNSQERRGKTRGSGETLGEMPRRADPLDCRGSESQQRFPSLLKAPPVLWNADPGMIKSEHG